MRNYFDAPQVIHEGLASFNLFQLISLSCAGTSGKPNADISVYGEENLIKNQHIRFINSSLLIPSKETMSQTDLGLFLLSSKLVDVNTFSALILFSQTAFGPLEILHVRCINSYMYHN